MRKEIMVTRSSMPPYLSENETWIEMLTGERFFWHLWGKVYRREVFTDIDPDISITTSEDLDLLWKIFRNGRVCKIWYSPLKVYHYFVNTESITAGMDMYIHRQSDLNVYMRVLNEAEGEMLEAAKHVLSLRAAHAIYEIVRDLVFRDKSEEKIKKYLDIGKQVMCYIGVEETGDFFVNSVKSYINGEPDPWAYFNKYFMNMRKGIAQAVEEDDKELYIYGTGIITRYVTEMIKNTRKLSGYVISDDQPSVQIFLGRPVYHISDIGNNKVCILLALNGKNQKEVMSRYGDYTPMIPIELPEVF